MDRHSFSQLIQQHLGAMSADALQGVDVILTEAEARHTALNQLAYILATAWWETANTMQPVREAFFIADNDFDKAERWRKKNLHYYPYYGRGYVQLTWKSNYQKASKVLGEDFVSNPDLVLKPANAVRILFEGMEEGWFTGKSLDDYIDEIDEPDDGDLKEYIEARRIINGTDKKETIGKIALHFEHSLRSAGYGSARSATASASGAVAADGTPFEAHIASFGLRYFKPYEFLVKGSQHTGTGAARGLNTDPAPKLWDNIKLTATILDELRHRLGRPIILTSVYRSPAYNAKIGGAANSLHMAFNAIDFSVRGSPLGPADWAAPLRDMRAAGQFSGGIGVYSTSVHLDTRGQNVDWTG